jgi:integrin-linked kinase-associated serine/threonine phosphatase 2C|mmetsp:Transcript_28960/g.46664  ORF Transcript_28960/g.46664 Transcript_28960/m.46664 type:complete len:412 (+) Transcript_28960:1-1236(+)
MKIYVRPPDGKKKDDIEMDLNADAILENLMKKIAEKAGIECNKLLFRGQTLSADKTLRSYDVIEGSTILIGNKYENQYLPMGVTPQMEMAEKRSGEDLEGEPEAKRAATEVVFQDVTHAEIKAIKARCATYGEKGMRRQMEDEYLISTSLKEHCPGLPEARDFALLAIFDGHGGKQVAMFIKTYLAVELANAFDAEDGPRDEKLSDKKLKKAVEASFQRLDSRIASELTGCYDGCTACVLLINAEVCVCANLGDTMAYLCRHNADSEIQAIPLQMRQHKCWMMKEKERILRAGGAVENGRINGVLEVSRAFGDITLKKFGVLCTPEYMKFRIDREKDQFVLIGCDGFWNAWTPAEALEMAQEVIESEVARSEREEDEVDLRNCCREIVQHVIEEKKAQDNVSVVLVQFLKA